MRRNQIKAFSRRKMVFNLVKNDHRNQTRVRAQNDYKDILYGRRRYKFWLCLVVLNKVKQFEKKLTAQRLKVKNN